MTAAIELAAEQVIKWKHASNKRCSTVQAIDHHKVVRTTPAEYNCGTPPRYMANTAAVLSYFNNLSEEKTASCKLYGKTAQ